MPSDGYTTDMRNSSNSNRDLETAMAGGDHTDTDVVADLVHGLREEVNVMGLPPQADEHVLQAVAAVPSTAAATATGVVPVSPRRLRTRLAIVMASMMALLLATTGVGLAADGASPGDALYGLDIALERVGINNGRAHERLTEAVALAEAGEIARGLNHAATTVATLPEGAHGLAAAQALTDAAARLAEDGNAPTGVSDLLAYLATAVGMGDGQGVADVAHQIRDTVERGRPDVPAGPPTSTPGRPDGLPGRGPGG